ncbi:MAG: PepSY domain-containing protein [Kiloniellales bacterium]
MLAEPKLSVPFIDGSAGRRYGSRMRRLAHIVAAATLAVCLAAPAAARDHDRARDAVRSGQARPLGQILGHVMSQCPGQFLDAQLRPGRGGLVYVIKLLRPGGRVAKLVVDARSGAIRGGRC